MSKKTLIRKAVGGRLWRLWLLLAIVSAVLLFGIDRLASAPAELLPPGFGPTPDVPAPTRQLIPIIPATG